MWITQRLQGHSSRSITTVHFCRRDGRQEDSEGIVVKEQEIGLFASSQFAVQSASLNSVTQMTSDLRPAPLFLHEECFISG